MNYVAYLVLRRLRAPLITLIVIWSIAVLGYVLIPGRDDHGNVYHMNFLHAFYFVSYMGSTIGFGEIPYAFTPVQRFWTLLCIYGTVIGWFYSIGAVVTILRDPLFLNLVRRTRFRHNVAGMREPFYLVCGYGLTGSALVTDLAAHSIQTVVLDCDPGRIEALELDNHPFDIPRLCADASDPEVLQDAGVRHPDCVGVLCLTNDDHVNLYVAIASKLLAPQRPVISRVLSADYAANLASFGTDHIIDPFETFAQYLVKSIVTPYHQLLYDWLLSPRHRSLESAHQLKYGRWIICGYGRFGQAVQRHFTAVGMETVIIEPEPTAHEIAPGQKVVKGLGTEAPTLEEADIANAVGIVAGTPDDANNLSIVMTAHQLKPDLVLVARQNRQANDSIFRAANIQGIMDPSVIIAQRIMFLIKTPLLVEFLDAIAGQTEHWCQDLLQRLENLVHNQALESWSFQVNETETPALMEAFAQDEGVPLSALSAHPHEREVQLPVLALMIERDKNKLLLPTPDTLLQAGDRILYCGLRRALAQMLWTVNNQNVLRYVVSGQEGASGYLWKKLLGLQRHPG